MRPIGFLDHTPPKVGKVGWQPKHCMKTGGGFNEQPQPRFSMNSSVQPIPLAELQRGSREEDR